MTNIFQNTNLATIDILIIAGYLAFCLVIGLLKYGKIRNIRDYTLGTRPFPTGVLIATTFATVISAKQIIGYSGKAYSLGLVFAVPTLLEPLCWFIMSKLLLPNLDYFRKKKFITLSEIMNHWYGKYSRIVTNCCSIIISIGVTAGSITTIGYLLNYFLHIPESLGMITGLLIVTTYSALGGIQAVAYTDLFQFMVFFLVIPIACIVGIGKANGASSIIENIPNINLQLSLDKSNFTLFLSFIVYALIPYGSIPYIQRALIARDTEQFKNTFIGTGILMFPLLIMILLIGMFVQTKIPGINPNVVLFYFIDSCLPHVMKGLMIAGLLAIVMSTQDSYINSSGILISRDICKVIYSKMSSKTELLIARMSSILIAFLSMGIVLVEKDILNILWLVTNFVSPLVTIPFLAGLLGVRINQKYFITLVFSALVTETTTRIITGSFDTISLMVGILTSIIVLYVGNRKYKKEHPELIKPKNKKPLSLRFMQAAKANNFKN